MAAAILRTRSRILSSAPPPSPIATGKGIRSAAVDDKILSDFLEKSLQLPQLTLPESYFPDGISPRIPAEVDLSRLISRDEDSVRCLLESAARLGAFQIIGHGISSEEIGAVIDGSDLAFRIPVQKKKSELIRWFGRGNNEIREDLFWLRSDEEMAEKLAEEVGTETYRTFRYGPEILPKHWESEMISGGAERSPHVRTVRTAISENIEKLFIKLGAVAENVGQILREHAKLHHHKRIEEKESTLCIHKYSEKGQNLLLDGQIESDKIPSHALVLILGVGDMEFRICSRKGSFIFTATAGSIIITVGDHLQEWSNGEFQSVIGEPIFEPVMDANPSFSIEFMSSPSSLNQKPYYMPKTISLIDQMLITLTIAILYNILMYISAKFVNT